MATSGLKPPCNNDYILDRGSVVLPPRDDLAPNSGTGSKLVARADSQGL